MHYVTFHQILSVCTATWLLVAGCGGNAPLPPAVTLRMEGTCSNTLLLEAFPVSPVGDTLFRDTLYGDNGIFRYALDGDTLYKLMFYPPEAQEWIDGFPVTNQQKVITLFAGKGLQNEVRARLDSLYADYSVQGNELSEAYARLFVPYRKHTAAFFANCQRKLSQATEADSLTVTRIYQDINLKYDSLQLLKARFRVSQPDCELAAWLLLDEPDSLLAEGCALLTDRVRNGLLKEAIDARLSDYEHRRVIEAKQQNFKPGITVPDFTLKDVEGRTVRSSDFRGKKYIVLDFWGTWCYWCMKGMPQMRACYDKYKDRVEFIGVNCHDKEEACRKAIAEKGMTWTQVINHPDSDTDLTELFAVSAYPTKIILSPQGILEGYFQGESEEFYQRLEQLLN